MFTWSSLGCGEQEHAALPSPQRLTIQLADSLLFLQQLAPRFPLPRFAAGGWGIQPRTLLLAGWGLEGLAHLLIQRQHAHCTSATQAKPQPTPQTVCGC